MKKYSILDCKEIWATRYNKTWEEVRVDLENGVAKIYDFEQIYDEISDLYFINEFIDGK